MEISSQDGYMSLNNPGGDGNSSYIKCLFDDKLDPSELKSHPKNRNIHPSDQIDRLAKIILYQGIRAPIVISSRSGYIVKGHGTREAIRRNKWLLAPVVYQDFESDEQEYAFVQSDNAIASWAELDLSGISTDLGDLGPDFDIELLGIRNFEIEIADKDPGCDEDEVPERAEPKTKPGDLYILGDHRLLCGDSTDILAVERLMDGNKASITFTSPPYNAAATPGGLTHSRHRKYLNWEMDQKTSEEYEQFLSDFLSLAQTVSDYQFINLQMLEGGKRSIIRWLGRFVDKYVDHMIWNKLSAAPTPPQTITPKHELIFVFSKDDEPNKRIATQQKSHFLSVLDINRNSHNEFAGEHQATFPVALSSEIIETFTEKGHGVYEPFAGSGTTMVACEKNNRRCYSMEIDPRYCDIGVARWEKYTGQKAVLDGAS